VGNYDPPPQPPYWTFTDAEPGIAKIRVWDDSYTESCGNYSYTSNKDQAVAGRAQYIATLTTQMAQHYQGPLDMVNKLVQHIADWDQHLIPRAPVGAPTASSDPSTWKGVVPNGDWVQGANVRYAALFANSAGKGPLGQYGAWVTVTDRSLPLVTGIPVDPLSLTTARHLHRQFLRPGQAEPDADTVVAIISDNETSQWQES
jgi:hypothetical protein